MGLQTGWHQALAAGTFGYEPNVNYLFGFPKSIKAGGMFFDIPLVKINATDDGHADKLKQFTLQTGILSSALEHAVPEQLFVNEQNPGEAISAVKALLKANAQGQRIYHITQANQATVLPNIHHHPDTMAEIKNALNAGQEVITHTDAVSVPGWSGAGYIITDPVTGDGAYKIAGGENGGYLLILSAAVLFIVALLVANPVLGIVLLSAALLLAGCGLSAIFKDDRYFDVYAFIAVSLIGGLLEAASAGSLTSFIIGAILELNLILSNLDDICANLDN